MLGTKVFNWLFVDTYMKNYMNQGKKTLKRKRKHYKDNLNR